MPHVLREQLKLSSSNQRQKADSPPRYPIDSFRKERPRQRRSEPCALYMTRMRELLVSL